MKLDRRKFVKVSSLAIPGLMIFPSACVSKQGGEAAAVDSAAVASDIVAPVNKMNLQNFGIQLYTLRDDMPKDPKGVLEKLSGFGYNQIEGYEGDMGLWWGMGHKEFKSYLDGLGLNFISSHCNPMENFEQKVAEAAEVGAKYLIAPWVGPQKSIEDFKRIADQFNKLGEVCRAGGLRFAYHNHDYSFVEVDGLLPQDVMIEGTDPELVDFEMDMYWVVTGGHDPVEWMKKYPGRFKLCHVKDRTKGVSAEDRESTCVLGEGSINYPAILSDSKSYGMEYFIVEQEKYEGTTPIASAEANAKYMKAL